MKKTLLLLSICLFASNIHAMNLVKDSDRQTPENEFIFNKINPSQVLKNGKSFAKEREEQFDTLTKLLNPRALAFIRYSPHSLTGQGINRALNLVASKMAYFIGEDAPVLKQDPLSQNPGGNPVAALFNQSARVSRDTITLLLPMDYYINREEFLAKQLGEKAEISHTAFLRSVEQLGMSTEEIIYIEEGKILTQEEVRELTKGTDILGAFDSKASFFENFKTRIKKEKLTDLIDEKADVTMARLLSDTDMLKKERAKSSTINFGTIQERALTILTNEKNGCSFNSNGSFSFDCNGELQTMTHAIADHKNLLLTKIHEIVMGMKNQAQTFQISADKKEFFATECQELQELVARAQERTSKLEFVLAADATAIGPRTYALCNLFATLENLSKQSSADKKAQETAEHIANHSFHMYKFVQMQG